MHKSLHVLSSVLLSLPSAAQSRSTPTASAANLPVTHVSLYKSGVGFFEHAGHVTGNQAVIIDFTSAQLNDVLQSLTAIDLAGGRIAGAAYNSTTPLEQQLRLLPLNLGQSPTSIDVYNAIRGARVEVHSASGSLSGRILSFEIRSAVPATPGEATPPVERHFLTIAADSGPQAGTVRTFELTPATTVRLLDAPLRVDLSRYLQLLDTSRSQSLRHLTLLDQGAGSRDLRVSYLSEVPIWKSTYRILFTDNPSISSAATEAHSEPPGGRTSPDGVKTATLQGWSVIDNTTGTDWINVHLSLIAGSPQSFIQPLSQPIYTRRPEIPIAEDAQLTPQTHESGEETSGLASPTKIPKDINMLKEDGAPPPQAPAVAGMSGTADRFTGGGIDTAGSGPMASASARQTVGGPVNSRQFDRLSKLAIPPAPYETAAAGSVTPNTTTAAFDDFFAYNLTDPVTILKNQSALVPILQTQIETERVTLWNPTQPQPLRALWITNTSPLTLDRGSFTIVENGGFGGQGLLDPIHPGERRLLSYAADQAVRVSTDYQHDTRKVQSITISRGVLKEETAEIAEVEYLVRNAAPDPRTVIVEQPVRQGWKLDSEVKPTETTPTVYRFRVATAPRETVRLHIGERHTVNQFFRLADSDEAQLTLLLRNANASPALLAQLEPVFAARRDLASIDTQINRKQAGINTIVEDQKRLRDNLSALKVSSDERTLAKRYTTELNTQEDTLATLRRDLATLQQQQATAQANLNNKIESLTITEKL